MLIFQTATHYIKTNPIDTNSIGISGTYGYESNFFKFGDEKIFQELNISLKKKINKKLKFNTTYINVFNNDKI